MKTDIHPAYTEVTVTCVCGHSFKTRSTMGKDFHVEICSECHPFFTGKQKLVDTAGRVDRFRKKYGDNYVKEGKKVSKPSTAAAPAAETKEAAKSESDATDESAPGAEAVTAETKADAPKAEEAPAENSEQKAKTSEEA